MGKDFTQQENINTKKLLMLILVHNVDGMLNEASPITKVVEVQQERHECQGHQEQIACCQTAPMPHPHITVEDVEDEEDEENLFTHNDLQTCKTTQIMKRGRGS
jgi:hypothetical protein